MSKIKAEVIADSKNPQGNRITSFVVQFPRIVLAELNTHRALSRNSASSRAIPFEKMLKRVQEEPFIPMAWQRDHKGMQGTEYISSPDEIEPRINDWLDARNDAVKRASYLSEMGVTKQLCNRLLEPFMYHTAIVTATELENFFYLRCPQYYTFDKNGKKITGFRSKKDVINYHRGLTMETEYDTIQWLKVNEGKGEIHIMALAEAMWDAFNESTPKELKQGEWHIPFGDKIDEGRVINAMAQMSTYNEDIEKEKESIKIRIATARCARVSYINYEGKDDYHADIKLHDNLSKAGHWSCFEHCAKVPDLSENTSGTIWSGNFKGFIQYRKMFDNENKTI